MPISESLIITLAGILVAGMGMALWYFKSILLTSRCTEATCCCFHWKNKPLRESNLLQILSTEQPPTLPGQLQQHRVSGRLSEGHPDPYAAPSRPPSHDRQRPYRASSPDQHHGHAPAPHHPPTVIEMSERSNPASFSFKDRPPPAEQDQRTSYVISPLGLP